MGKIQPFDDFPLLVRTPLFWAESVLKEPLALLSDHAYLEKKAASNAMELMNRWPGRHCPVDWLTTLAAIAHDEASHLASVIRLLTRRGGRLERTHRNGYASELRDLVRKGMGNQEILDRLLISALIEVRSCERFDVLARASELRDRELTRFYQALGASELGHYRVFLSLAGFAAETVELQDRWTFMVEAESRIISIQPPGAGIHSGVPSPTDLLAT